MSSNKRSKRGIGITGSKPVLWERPGQLNNSQLTLTSRRLSQNSIYSSGNLRRPAKHVSDSSREYFHVVEDSRMAHHPKKVTFNHSKSTSLTNGELRNGTINGEISSANSDISSGSGQYSSSRHWYTKPIHLSARDIQQAYSASSQMVNGNSERHLDSPNPNINIYANGIESSSRSPSQKLRHNTSTSSDEVSHQFFPVTLGAAYALNEIDPSKISTISPPAMPLAKPVVPWKLNKHSKSSNRKSRPSSAQSSSSSTSRNSIDKMYMMHVEAPALAGSASVLLSSPFQSELAMLRMERLRIEEEHLLEVKRQEELERIRGPQPKWYEMKSPNFHYEAHKNNQLLKSSSDWQALLDYRTELEHASQQFRKSVNNSS